MSFVGTFVSGQALILFCKALAKHLAISSFKRGLNVVCLDLELVYLSSIIGSMVPFRFAHKSQYFIKRGKTFKSRSKQQKKKVASPSIFLIISC